jgi:hypothetical protein
MALHGMNDVGIAFNHVIIQQIQALIKMNHNGSIDQFISMPAVNFGENCLHIGM